MIAVESERNGDFVYKEPCGCQAVFSRRSRYLSSMMIAGNECRTHKNRAHIEARDEFMDRAKAAKRKWLQEADSQ